MHLVSRYRSGVNSDSAAAHVMQVVPLPLSPFACSPTFPALLLTLWQRVVGVPEYPPGKV